MKKHTLYIGILGCILLIAIFSYYGKEKENTGQIVIGAPLSLSGTAATDGENIKKGLDLAAEDLAKKGVHVKIVYEDDHTNPKDTLSAVNKLLSMDKPHAIIGPTWGYLLDAVGGILDKAEVVSFSPANTSEFVNVESKYVFYGSIKNMEKKAPIEKWLKEHDKKRIGIIIDQSAWGESHLAPFREASAATGGEVFLVEKIPLGAEKDTLPTVLAKAKALNLDALLVTGYEEGLTILIKRTQEQNPGLTILVAEEIPRTLLRKEKISLSETNEVYIVTPRVSEAFSLKFKEKYGEVSGNYSERAYDGLMLIAEALHKKEEDESLADYLHTKTNYKGYATTYSFDENGDIKGGEWLIEKLQ